MSSPYNLFISSLNMCITNPYTVRTFSFQHVQQYSDMPCKSFCFYAVSLSHPYLQKKFDRGARAPKTWRKHAKTVPSPERPSGSGLGHFSALIPSQDRPLRPKTDRLGPKTSQDRQHRFQERPRIANVGSKSGPRPPTEGPRAAQDHTPRPQIALPL